MEHAEILQAERLDQYVTAQLETVSRAFAAKLIERGDVRVNNKPEHKAGFKVRPGDIVVINYDATKEVLIPDIEIEVIYEDKDCVVINKPVGVLSHSKGAFNPEGTVASWLQSRIKMTGERAGIVHRLDRATSGVMICAKNPEAMAWLQKQFSQRRVKKTYVAVVKGAFKQRQAIIDMPIERNPKKPQTFRVGSNGKSAQTEYWVLETNDKYSLVELKPTTGRTHQLRVHLEHLGHPIVGDAFYGGPKADRLFLHAHQLELTLPNKERKTFEVPVPEEFKELVQE